MHDIRALVKSPETFIEGWTTRGMSDAAAAVAELIDLDRSLRAAQTASQEALASRNEASKRIGQAKGRKDEAEAARLMAEVETLKGVIAETGETETRLAEPAGRGRAARRRRAR
jgi:seryl-tRNA synthetase